MFSWILKRRHGTASAPCSVALASPTASCVTRLAAGAMQHAGISVELHAMFIVGSNIERLDEGDQRATPNRLPQAVAAPMSMQLLMLP